MPGFRLLRAFVPACLLASFGLAGGAVAANHTVSGFVWIDANSNGLTSVWETPFPGATVTLLDPLTSNALQTATSDASGNYALLDVPAGGYRITLTLPSGYMGAINAPIAIAADTVRNFRVTEPKSREEKALNAFGDRWSLAKRNPSLRLANGVGCYRKPIQGMSHVFTQEELQFQGRLAARFYIEGCAIVLETDPPFENKVDYQSSEKLEARVDAFKDANPSLKYLAYQPLAEWGVGQVGWAQIYDNHKDWFVYKKGSTDQSEANIISTKSRAWLLDITNPEYQDFIAARLAQALDYYQIDGMVLDNVHPLPRIPDHNEMPDDTRAAWPQGWVDLLTKFKAAIGPKKFIFASVPRDDLVQAQRIIPIVDGIMLEDTFSPVKNDIRNRINLQKDIFAAAAAAKKWILTTENTFVDGSKFTTTTGPKERALSRYYLAAFYIFDNGRMIFYHNPPAATAPQYAAEAFFTDWNVKVGQRGGPYQQAAQKGVYIRNYSNSIIYLNNGTLPYKITVPASSPYKFDPDGKAITRYTIPPKSGFMLSRAQAFQ